MNRAVAALAWVVLAAGPAQARPPGPVALCDVWPEAADCVGGSPDCTTCHTSPPARNAFGLSIEDKLLPGAPRPLTDEAFYEALPDILRTLAHEDADADGFDNQEEFLAGSSPADPGIVPHAFEACDQPGANPDYDVCGYDPAYAFKKINLDVCGRAPDWAGLKAFRALERRAQMDTLDSTLETCLDTAFWRGRDGVLWRLAHAKIRPLQAIKSGPGGGRIPLADYEDDYHLFSYTQTDDRDAREVLNADYYVQRTSATEYTKVANLPGKQFTPAPRRSGMLTTGWFFTINTMFTPVPRTTAAQAYRSYLGLDIAKSEGLMPPPEPLVDYDDKGITADACAVCHTTLDPLAYPFSRYWGIAGENTGVYDPRRPRRFDRAEGSRLDELPEAGYLLGERVDTLLEWADVAADSEAFARATVRDYWRHFIGHEPTVGERAEFEALVADFPTEHAYRVERMLHALIRTEAYGVP